MSYILHSLAYTTSICILLIPRILTKQTSISVCVCVWYAYQSFFSIARIEYCDKSVFKEKGFIFAYSSRRTLPNMEERHNNRQGRQTNRQKVMEAEMGSWLLKPSVTHTGSREEGQEVGSACTLSKPTPSKFLLSAISASCMFQDSLNTANCQGPSVQTC